MSRHVITNFKHNSTKSKKIKNKKNIYIYVYINAQQPMIIIAPGNYHYFD